MCYKIVLGLNCLKMSDCFRFHSCSNYAWTFLYKLFPKRLSTSLIRFFCVRTRNNLNRDFSTLKLLKSSLRITDLKPYRPINYID